MKGFSDGSGEPFKPMNAKLDPDVASYPLTEKRWGPQRRPENKIDRRNTFSSVVVDEKNPNWPPTFHKCKIPSSDGFQGAWRAPKRHSSEELTHLIKFQWRTERNPDPRCSGEERALWPKSSEITSGLLAVHPDVMNAQRGILRSIVNAQRGVSNLNGEEFVWDSHPPRDPEQP